MGAGPADHSLPNQIPQPNNIPPNSNVVGMEYQGAAYGQAYDQAQAQPAYDQAQAQMVGAAYEQAQAQMVGAENPDVILIIIVPAAVIDY